MGDVFPALAAIVTPDVILDGLTHLLCNTAEEHRHTLAASAHSGTPIPDVCWRPMEASLYAIKALGRAVPTTEAKYLPLIFRTAFELPNHPKLRYECDMEAY